MRIFLLFLSLAIFQLGAQAFSSAPQPRVIRIDGNITANTLFHVSTQLAHWTNEDPIPGGLIVLLNSPGGDGEAAMQIGRILRQKKAHTFVTGRCESACVFILAGGVARAARPGTVGVHAGRLTVSDPDGKILKEIDATRSLNDSFMIAAFNSDIRKYFAEMGVEHGLLDVILAHRTRQTYKLSDEQMKQYQVIGFDNQYLRERTRMFDTLPGNERIHVVALYDRTLSVPGLCQSRSFVTNAFVDCYQNVLFGGKAPKPGRLFR